jgi:carbohydrate-selective porin OprB
VGAEAVLEVNHRFKLTRWFYVTPDFQYVSHPEGLESVAARRCSPPRSRSRSKR